MSEESATTRIDIALMNKSAYPEHTEKVELVQTHISYVFLTDNFVYKMKKPVNFGFLDFSTLEKRRHYCEKEVELNKRLSPDVYLGVLPVTRSNGDVTIGGKGEVVEYVVKMKRVSMENLMIRLLRENRLTREMVENVARRIAQFHGEATTSEEIRKFGGVDVIRTNTDENFAQTQKYVGSTITRAQFDAIRNYTADHLDNRAELFEKRVEENRIRDCHGDLHLEHICITKPIRMIDCIEFNDRFRYSDTAADIAFLAMDLDFNGRRDLSEALMDAYIQSSGDEGARGVVNFYKVYRAYVRGKVTSFRLDGPKPIPEKEREEILRTARKYFTLAASYVEEEMPERPSTDRPRLVITCGLMGTGKTTVAREIADRNGWEMISSDAVRKKLAGMPATRHEYIAFEKGVYSPEFTEKTYNRMNQTAEEFLRKGRSVVIDAAFGKKSEREKIHALAKAMNAQFTCIELVCPEGRTRKRLEGRMHKRGAISDGRWEIFPQQKASFEKVDEFGNEEHIVVDTSTPKHETLKKVMDKFGTGTSRTVHVETHG